MCIGLSRQYVTCTPGAHQHCIDVTPLPAVPWGISAQTIVPQGTPERLPLARLLVRTRAVFAHVKAVWTSMEKSLATYKALFQHLHAHASIRGLPCSATQTSPLQLLHASEEEAIDDDPVQQNNKNIASSGTSEKDTDYVSASCVCRTSLLTKLRTKIQVMRCKGQF